MKSLIAYTQVLREIKNMIDSVMIKHKEMPNVVYLGKAQIEALNDCESIQFPHPDIEKNEIVNLEVVQAQKADFIGVGGARNTMSAISPDLVAARAEMMLGEHFRNIDYPDMILLGLEQMNAAEQSEAFDVSRIDVKYFHGVKIKVVPVLNYIEVV